MAGTRALFDVRSTFAGTLPRAGVVVMAAAMLAGAATLATSQTLIPRGPGTIADPPAATFAERFFVGPVQSDCTAESWPYFAAHCLRMPDGSRARPVRTIAIDRQSSDRIARPLR